MTRQAFRDALADLRTAVLEMSDLVLDQLESALTALQAGDDDLAREVIGGDAEINRRYLALEADCIDIFALEQPVASDLRLVAASFKIITDLERVGDLAANLGRYALSSRLDAVPAVDLAAIGRVARELLADALDAYERERVEDCRAIADRDDELDGRCQRASARLVRELLESDPEIDAWALEALLDDVAGVLLTIRDLERVGDHAVNIAARTLYAVDGEPELIY